MGASLEPLCEHVLIARVGPRHVKLGDPYTWSVVVVRDGATALLKAAQRAPTPEELKAGEEALRSAGFTRRRYLRIDGREEEQEL